MGLILLRRRTPSSGATTSMVVSSPTGDPPPASSASISVPLAPTNAHILRPHGRPYLLVVALMLSGMGSASVDVFRMASSRWEKRQAKVLQQAKLRMMNQKDSGQGEQFWNNVWGKPRDYKNSEDEVKERAKRAAAAARRWREYSRRGVDKPPTFKLPEAISDEEN